MPYCLPPSGLNLEKVYIPIYPAKRKLLSDRAAGEAIRASPSLFGTAILRTFRGKRPCRSFPKPFQMKPCFSRNVLPIPIDWRQQWLIRSGNEKNDTCMAQDTDLINWVMAGSEEQPSTGKRLGEKLHTHTAFHQLVSAERRAEVEKKAVKEAYEQFVGKIPEGAEHDDLKKALSTPPRRVRIIFIMIDPKDRTNSTIAAAKHLGKASSPENKKGFIGRAIEHLNDLNSDPSARPEDRERFQAMLEKAQKDGHFHPDNTAAFDDVKKRGAARRTTGNDASQNQQQLRNGKAPERNQSTEVPQQKPPQEERKGRPSPKELYPPRERAASVGRE